MSILYYRRRFIALVCVFAEKERDGDNDLDKARELVSYSSAKLTTHSRPFEADEERAAPENSNFWLKNNLFDAQKDGNEKTSPSACGVPATRKIFNFPRYLVRLGFCLYAFALCYWRERARDLRQFA